MLGIVAIAPNVGRPSRHCWRRRLSGADVAGGKFRGSVWTVRFVAGKASSAAGCAEPTSVTSQPSAKSRISALVYSRLTVPLVPSTDTRFVLERAQAGLIAGTVPTKGVL